MFHISAKAKLLGSILLSISLFAALNISVSAQERRTVAAQPNASVTVLDSTREQDGLIGPVRRVRTETVKLSNKSGKVVEGTRALLETTTYSLEGKRIENAYYLAASNSTTSNASMGKEEYKYDDKGNIKEMTLRAADGSPLSKEIYTYEFDAVGNWTKMIASLAVFEAGKLSYEPIEATYRTITYYFNEATAKVAAKPASSATPASSIAPTSTLNASSTAATIVGGAKVETATSNADKKLAAPQPANKNIVSAPLNESAEKIAALSSNGSRADVNAKTAKISSPTDNSARAKLGDERQTASSLAVAVAAPQPFARLISSEAKANRVIKLPNPVYPESARHTGASGKVSVKVIIDSKGKVISARAVSGLRVFEEAALSAARQSLFSPTSGAKGAKTNAIITYVFSFTP